MQLFSTISQPDLPKGCMKQRLEDVGKLGEKINKWQNNIGMTTELACLIYPQARDWHHL